MMNLYELGQEVIKIREAVDSMTVKGKTNAALVVYCFDKCNAIINAINEAAASPPAQTEESDPPQEGGEDE